MRIAAVLIMVLTLSSCRSPLGFGDKVCTMEFRMGLNVYVKDSLSGAFAASGATLIVREAAFSDSMAFPQGRPDLDSLPLYGAGERAGVYDLTVRKPGYAAWQKANVRVTAGDCHVNTLTLTASLVR